ncbi:Methyltransferase domain protein [uncultured archaeon]|nr:Methyltransferase domain protein [uncultured archaeon]
MLQRNKAQGHRGVFSPFWERVFRPEGERLPNRAEREATKVRIGRVYDREGRWFVFGTPSHAVEEKLGFPLTDYILRQIGSNGFSEKHKFGVLELGCGTAEMAGHLKSRFGENMRYVGQVLERTKGMPYAGVDRLIEGEIRRLAPRENFDLIFSGESSALHHTLLKQTAVEKIMHWLKPGGLAVLDMGCTPDGGAYSNGIKTILLQNGIRDYTWNSFKLTFSKPAPRLPA